MRLPVALALESWRMNPPASTRAPAIRVTPRRSGGALRYAIIVFALLVMAAFWIAAVALGRHDLARTLAEVDDQNINLARTLSAHAARTIDYADRLALQVKARHEQSGRAFDLGGFGRDGGINRTIVSGIAIVDARGNVRQFDAPLTAPPNLADREHFKVHTQADAGQPYVSPPLLSQVHSRYIIVVSRRLNRRDGAYDGSVGVAINPDSFTDFFRTIELGEQGVISLIGLDGFVRARNTGGGDGIGQDVRKSPPFAQYAKRETGTARYRSVIDGVTRRVAFRRLDNYPLVLQVGEAEEAVLAEVNGRARALYTGAALASLLAICAAAALLVMVRRREQDATRRHDVERELALSHQRRDALMQGIPAPAYLKDRGGRFVAVNRAWYERFDFAPGYAIGRTAYEVFPAAFADARAREDRLVVATRTEQRIERTTVVAGKSLWIETVKTPIFDERGEVSGIVGISYDVTARRTAEEELRASEERFRQFSDSVDAVFWMTDLDPQRVVYVNRAFTQIWGVEVAALYANPRLRTDAIHVDDRARVAAEFEQWLRDAPAAVYRAEYRIVRPDGGVRWIRDRGTKLLDAQGAVYRLQGIADDISEQREAELALADSQQRRDALLESIPDVAWLKHRDGHYIAVNRAWSKRYGIDAEHAVGLTDADLFPPARAAMLAAEEAQVISAREERRFERQVEIAGQARWVEAIKTPLIDRDGVVTSVVGVSRDITERIRTAELVRGMNAALSQKAAELTAANQELEAFAYSVSHDLRAPLRHVDGFVNLLQKHAGSALDGTGRHYLERIIGASATMARLIDDLLRFSRTSRADLRNAPVALDKVVSEIVRELAAESGGRSIEWSVGKLPVVQGDFGLLRQAFYNLLENAVKYTRPQSAPRIEITCTEKSADAVIMIRDNGVGFDMQYSHKLFGVFQRLHRADEFEGTGIGLANVARIVQRHGGRVWAEGVKGRGAAFFVALPSGRKA